MVKMLPSILSASLSRSNDFRDWPPLRTARPWRLGHTSQPYGDRAGTQYLWEAFQWCLQIVSRLTIRCTFCA